MAESIVLLTILVAIFNLCTRSKVDKDISAIREQLEAAAELKAASPDAYPSIPAEELTQALDACEKRMELERASGGAAFYDDPTALDRNLPPLLRS